jgi:hypothetical protein
MALFVTLLLAGITDNIEERLQSGQTPGSNLYRTTYTSKN